MHKKPWAFNLGKTRFGKPLYTRPRWGFTVQNIPGYAFEIGLVTPLFHVQRSGKATKRFYLVLTAGTYKEEMVFL